MDGKNIEASIASQAKLGQEPQSPLEARLSALGKTFAQCDALIPRVGLAIRPKDFIGPGVDKEKEFRPADALDRVKTSLIRHFPDPNQQIRIIEDADQFLQQFVGNLHESERNSVPAGQFDRFISDFPDNMLDGLNSSATPEVVGRLFQIGSQAIGASVRQVENLADRHGRNTEILNGDLGNLALLMGYYMPGVIAQDGDNQTDVLDRLEHAAKSLLPAEFVRYVQQLRKTAYRSPEANLKILAFRETLLKVIPDIASAPNPFIEAQRQPWKTNSLIGKERRLPTWADIGAMTLSCVEDNNEYGIDISRNSADIDPPVLQYIRGRNGTIKNGSQKIQSTTEELFFHAHPSIASSNAATSPLVSFNDFYQSILDANGRGGFWNISCAKGLTLHLGVDVASKEISGDELAPDFIYQGESGPAKDIKILPLPVQGQTTEVMKRLGDTGLPYVYSMQDSVTGLKYYFVHIPWNQLDTSVSFADLCFGDGLPRLLKGMYDLPDIPVSANLVQATRDTEEKCDNLASKELS